MTARRPTRQMVPHVAELSDACRQHLLNGFSFFGEGYPESAPTALERMREDWQTHR